VLAPLVVPWNGPPPAGTTVGLAHALTSVVVVLVLVVLVVVTVVPVRQALMSSHAFGLLVSQ